MADDTTSVNASIVMLGKFNPAIFTPAWFAKNDLFSDAELRATQLGIAHNSITQFVMEWLTVEVQPNRFLLQTASDPFLRILDMTTHIFGQLLPHSHIIQLGINYGEEFILDDWKRRHALGRALAPLEPWGEWANKLNKADYEATGGMISLVMREQYEPQSIGFRRVEVEPSEENAPGRGVSVKVNDHRNVVGDRAQEDTTIAMKILRDDFESSIAQSKWVVNELRNFALGIQL